MKSYDQPLSALGHKESVLLRADTTPIYTKRAAQEEHKQLPHLQEQRQRLQRQVDLRQAHLVGMSGSSGVCAIDGSQTGDGCHGHACLLGACFCRDGSGGDFCERRSLHRRSCDSEAADAYSLRSTGLMRYALHDACAFYEPAYGIMHVDDRRWRAAQQWEAALWTNAPATQTVDRNQHHAANFANYASLPAALGHVLEIGCGPFTQVQTLLRDDSQVLSITLVDPLAGHYMERTKGCTYRGRRISKWPVRVLSMQAELLRLKDAVDTVIMVAVLQSVQDVPAVLQAAYNALRPGGWLVFSDRIFDSRWDAYRHDGHNAAPFWDVGHPCAIKQTVLDHFLATFEEVHLRRFSKESLPGRPQLPPSERDEQLYFIGRKLAT